jgi:predicted RNase H-like HicB family nuclease
MCDLLAGLLTSAHEGCRHAEQRLQASRTEEVRFDMRYASVIEKAEGNYSAYVPDLPGCVATAATLEEIEAEIRQAIAFHLDGLREDGLPVPPAASTVEYVEVTA